MVIRRTSDGKVYRNILEAVEDFKCPGPCVPECPLHDIQDVTENYASRMCMPVYAEKHPYEVAERIGCTILPDMTCPVTSLGTIIAEGDKDGVTIIIQRPDGSNRFLARIYTAIAANKDTCLKIKVDTQSGSALVHELYREGPSARREEILKFIKFEDATSKIWPWAMSAEDIMGDDLLLYEIERRAPFEGDRCDTVALYHTIDEVVGVNPALV